MLLDNKSRLAVDMYVFLQMLYVAATAAFTFDELWALQTSLWEQFLYPANLQQINATETSVFAENVSIPPGFPISANSVLLLI
jgi:hypothetical protein